MRCTFAHNEENSWFPDGVLVQRSGPHNAMKEFRDVKEVSGSLELCPKNTIRRRLVPEKVNATMCEGQAKERHKDRLWRIAICSGA